MRKHILVIAVLLLMTGTSAAHAGQWTYTCDALPSASGFTLYGSYSRENGDGITSTISSGQWILTDNSTSYRCMENNTTLGDVTFNTGATLAARVACSSSSSATHNLGISNNSVGAMYIAISTTQIQLIQYDGTVRGSWALDGTSYHRYYLTVRNATQGDNNTATWRVYVDGAEVITWVGTGVDESYDGFFAGHAGRNGRGTWSFEWIAARNDGAYGPAEWDPVPSTVPGPPTVIAPGLGSTVTTQTPTIEWQGDPHDAYAVRINTTNNPADTDIWNSGVITSPNSYCVAGPLPNGTPYYIFARVHNSLGWGPWSAAGYWFTVDAPVSTPGAPDVILPLTGTTVAMSKPTVQWISDPHDAYEVHVNTADNPTVGIVWDSGQVTSSANSRDAGPLANGTYYVFVRVRNLSGWGPWSAAGGSFTVSISASQLRKGWVLIRDDLSYHLDLLTKAPSYHVNHVQISHDIMMYAWEPINDLTKRSKINQLIDAAHANGVAEAVLWTHEIQFPNMPSQFLVGGKVNLDDPGYWIWLDSEYETLFTVCPSADGLILTLTENWDGADPFDRTKTIHTGKTPEDSIYQVVQALWNVCQRHGKSLYVRTWTGAAGADRWIRDAVKRCDPAVWMMSKATGAGDWNVIQEDYDIIGTCTGHREMQEFDFAGEYWGLTNTPWCGVAYQKHLFSEFAVPRGIDGVVARVDRGDSGGLQPRAIECPNRINMYALDVLADYPDMTEEDIYDWWCANWFGLSAADRVKSALKRAFDITNACYDLPLVYSFSDDVARDYLLRSLFDIDCASTALKSSSTFLPGSGQTNYDVLHDPFLRAATRLGVSAPTTLFGDFSPAYSPSASPTCVVTVVDATEGLNPASFKVEYSTDVGATWTNHTNFTYTSDGDPIDPYHITANSIPFGTPRAGRNKVRFSATNLVSVTTKQVFTVRGQDEAYATLGSSIVSDGIYHPQGGDGDTVATTAGGRSCRTPASSSDTYFYFQADDGFAYDRSPETIYLQVDYYGSTGSITPIYDGVERTDETLTPVYLNGSSSWRTATWQLDNVNFGNRIDPTGMKSDFRLYVGSGTGVCISGVRLYYSRPTNTLDQPQDLHATSVTTAQISLAWDAVPGAAKYQVCRGATCIGWPTQAGFTDSGLSPNTQYTYTVTAFDAGTVAGCASQFIYATAAPAPPTAANVTCPIPTATWQTSNTFTFTAVNGFGAGKVAYYRYVWDETPTHTWSGSESTWPAVSAPSAGWTVWHPTMLPSDPASGWLLYDGSTTQRLVSEGIVTTDNAQAWEFSDQGRVWNTKSKMGLWPILPIDRNVGATLVVRMKPGLSPVGFHNSSVNFGFNFLDCEVVGVKVRPDLLELTGPSGSTSAAVDANPYSFHTYALTVKNATPGNDSTCRFDLYRDGTYLTSLTQGPDGSVGMWSGPMFGHITSNATGMWHFEWLAWRNDGTHVPSPTGSQLTLTAPHYGNSFYLHLQGFNADGTPNGTLDLGPYYYWDGTTPYAPTVTDDGDYTTRDAIHATWTVAGPSIERYEYAVGSSPGAQDVLAYSSAGQALEVTRTGLSMTDGQTYYVSVRAYRAGVYGPAGSSDGIEVAPVCDHIGQAKGLTDDSPVALYGKYVTAVFGDCDYIQEGSVAGLRVVTSRPIQVGDLVDLAGVMSRTGTERTILADTVINRNP